MQIITTTAENTVILARCFSEHSQRIELRSMGAAEDESTFAATSRLR